MAAPGCTDRKSAMRPDASSNRTFSLTSADSRDSVKAHARGAEPSDDITLMALVWRGSRADKSGKTGSFYHFRSIDNLDSFVNVL